MTDNTIIPPIKGNFFNGGTRTSTRPLVAVNLSPREKIKHDTQVGYLIGTTCPPSGGLFAALCTVGGATIGTLRATADVLGKRAKKEEKHVKPIKIDYYQDV